VVRKGKASSKEGGRGPNPRSTRGQKHKLLYYPRVLVIGTVLPQYCNVLECTASYTVVTAPSLECFKAHLAGLQLTTMYCIGLFPL